MSRGGGSSFFHFDGISIETYLRIINVIRKNPATASILLLDPRDNMIQSALCLYLILAVTVLIATVHGCDANICVCEYLRKEPIITGLTHREDPFLGEGLVQQNPPEFVVKDGRVLWARDDGGARELESSRVKSLDGPLRFEDFSQLLGNEVQGVVRYKIEKTPTFAGGAPSGCTLMRFGKRLLSSATFRETYRSPQGLVARVEMK